MEADPVRRIRAWGVHAEACLASRTLFAIELVLILGLGAGLALWLQPEPHSDWLYYWTTAGSIAGYERGGLGLWLLAIPKALGCPPVIAALLLNLPAAAIMLWLARSADTGRARWFALPVALYLLMLTPYAGIVQLDLVAATLLAGGIWLVMAMPPRWPRLPGLVLAVLLVVMAVSTRTQYALTLWTMLILLALPWWLLRRRRPDALVPILMGVLLLGSVGGFAVDSGLRAAGGKSETARIGLASTLYSGLLLSGDVDGCGHWSPEAAVAAREDAGKPLHQAVLERLGDRPASHWVSVLRCKLPDVMRPKAFAVYWLVESPNVRTGINASPQSERINALYSRVLDLELRAWRTLGLLTLLAVPVVCLRLWRADNPLVGLIPVLWIASFWAVHAVFEIQGRYFLGMLLLTPLLCALAIRNGRSRMPGAGEQPFR